MQSLEKIKSAVSNFPTFIESSVKPYLHNRCHTFKAGYIANSLPAWQKLTNNTETISTVMGMSTAFDFDPKQHYLPHLKRTQAESVVIDSEIRKLLMARNFGHALDNNHMR